MQHPRKRGTINENILCPDHAPITACIKIGPWGELTLILFQWRLKHFTPTPNAFDVHSFYLSLPILVCRLHEHIPLLRPSRRIHLQIITFSKLSYKSFLITSVLLRPPLLLCPHLLVCPASLFTSVLRLLQRLDLMSTGLFRPFVERLV